MLYAEQQESNMMRLTRYPAVTIEDVIRRYNELPNARKRKKTSLEDALRQLQQLNLIRSASGGSLRVSNTKQVIELLPTLEVIVPAGNAQKVADRLAEYFSVRQEDNTGDDEGGLEYA
jgi:hypothetical protein